MLSLACEDAHFDMKYIIYNPHFEQPHGFAQA
jgi:hypothetical protein